MKCVREVANWKSFFKSSLDFKAWIKTPVLHHQNTPKKIRTLTKNILPLAHNKTMHNLSTIMLTTEELDVFKYGLKYPVHPLDINETDVLTVFDFIFRTMAKDF